MPKKPGYQKLKNYRLGEEKRQSCGLMAKIIDYPSAADMTVQFEDGKIINHVSYYSFSQGTLNYNKQDMPEMAKNYRVGEKSVCSNEMVATITQGFFRLESLIRSINRWACLVSWRSILASGKEL